MKKRLFAFVFLNMMLLPLGLSACAPAASNGETTAAVTDKPENSVAADGTSAAATTTAEPKKSEPEISLEGKTIVWLGSSVTYGHANRGESMAEYLERSAHCISAKYAVSGTTLVDNGDNSYISRMKKIPTDQKCDYFICQLSTNDATQKKPLGKISDSFDIDSFDTSTVCGAIEYVIAYAKERFGCPVAFYTNPPYDSAEYRRMVSSMLKIKEKWGIEVLDLWNNEDLAAMSREERDAFLKRNMADSIHPNALGYRRWLTPIFEEFIKKTIVK